MISMNFFFSENRILLLFLVKFQHQIMFWPNVICFFFLVFFLLLLQHYKSHKDPILIRRYLFRMISFSNHNPKMPISRGGTYLLRNRKWYPCGGVRDSSGHVALVFSKPSLDAVLLQITPALISGDMMSKCVLNHFLYYFYSVIFIDQCLYEITKHKMNVSSAQVFKTIHTKPNISLLIRYDLSEIFIQKSLVWAYIQFKWNYIPWLKLPPSKCNYKWMEVQFVMISL